jgi:CDP-paratose 2-epimerase
VRVLITGICGFVGSTLAEALLDASPGIEIVGIDNFIRPGSEVNRLRLRARGVRLHHGDIRAAADFEALPAVDWVLDAAANPSVLAGTDGQSSSRQVVEHNLGGTINLLEYCKRHGAGFILLSTSRVYSIAPLAELPVESVGSAYRPRAGVDWPVGISESGVSELFSTAPPISLYGSTKLASELLALEYGATFGFPVWIDRCGVLAGAGQFGRPDQGIFAYWINAWLRRRPLSYIGFAGTGHQVRDCLHPRDLVPVLQRQMEGGVASGQPRVLNFGGGTASAMSLAELSAWCAERFGAHEVTTVPAPRRFDVPWLVMDARQAETAWGWRPRTPVAAILEEIAQHAEAHPEWLSISEPS